MKEMTPEGKAAELLPCPFCNGLPEIKQTGRKSMKIRCSCCHFGLEQAVVRFDLGWLERRLSELWNKRQSPTHEAVAVACMYFVKKMVAETGQAPALIVEAMYQNNFILDEGFVKAFCKVNGK